MIAGPAFGGARRAAIAYAQRDRKLLAMYLNMEKEDPLSAIPDLALQLFP